jgi:hypothetical protein
VSIPTPSPVFDRLHFEIEEASGDVRRLRHLRREVSACAELSDSEREWLSMLTGQYQHGCMPPEVEVYPEPSAER